jgi:hypothetical protein
MTMFFKIFIDVPHPGLKLFSAKLIVTGTQYVIGRAN